MSNSTKFSNILALYLSNMFRSTLRSAAGARALACVGTAVLQYAYLLSYSTDDQVSAHLSKYWNIKTCALTVSAQLSKY